MTNMEIFLMLIQAGISTQITSSARAIRCMAIAIEVSRVGGVGGYPTEKLAEMALNFIKWQFNDGKKPKWVRIDENRFTLGLS